MRQEFRKTIDIYTFALKSLYIIIDKCYKTSIKHLYVKVVSMDKHNESSRVLRMRVREVTWLWHYLARAGVEFNECQLDSTTMRFQLRNHISTRDIEKLEYAKDTQFLPDEDFKWVDKSERQSAWLVRKALELLGERSLLPALATLPTRQQFIAIFDIWETRLSVKRRAIDTLKNEWREHQLDDKLFNWMKGEEEQAKCSMAWEWMIKHQPRLIRRASPWGSHAELMEFFDRQDITPAEKELFATKIKRRWSTRKTRENSPHKKQYNFVLANDVNAALNQLALKHKISRTKVLETLILHEAAGGLYLDKPAQIY